MHDGQQTLIEGPQGAIEAFVYQASRDRPTMILCHPHPSFGGSCHDRILRLIGETLRSLDCGLVYFNFAGIGASEGHTRNAQQGAEDLQAVQVFVNQTLDCPYGLVGYSFGAAAVLTAARAAESEPALLVAPVLSLCAPDVLNQQPALARAVVGDQDVYSPVSGLVSYFGGSSVEVIEGADHFFNGYDGLLVEAARRWVSGL
jgi:alpha/beta superfamily hydrolase